MTCPIRQCCFLWCMVFIVCSAKAQSIAASLACYKKVYKTKISGISAKNLSGITFRPESKTLYLIDNKNPTVYEVTTSGKLIRRIALYGFEDTEGIAYQSDNYFFIVEERKANCIRILLPQTGSGPVLREKGFILSIAEDFENEGLEDVAYSAVTNTVYLVKECNPSRLYSVTLDSSGNPAACYKNKPFDIENIRGDAAGIYALSDGNFLLVNQEKDELVGYSSDGELLSELDLDMDDPEGVTINPDNGTIYIVGEPKKLYVFAK